MSVKEELHRLIDGFDEQEAEEALDYLNWLASEVDTLTDNELAAVKRGEEDLAKGDYVSLDEFRSEMKA